MRRLRLGRHCVRCTAVGRPGASPQRGAVAAGLQQLHRHPNVPGAARQLVCQIRGNRERFKQRRTALVRFHNVVVVPVAVLALRPVGGVIGGEHAIGGVHVCRCFVIPINHHFGPHKGAGCAGIFHPDALFDRLPRRDRLPLLVFFLDDALHCGSGNVVGHGA